MDKKVLVGMSGGVDSSFTLYLLREQGYDVIGVTLRLEDTESECCKINDARSVANLLSVPHYVKDVVSDFRSQVIDYFCNEYMIGKTPNPCVVCNEKIKFKYLLILADELGCSFVATGHYAKVEYDGSLGVYILKKGKDRLKDQSYFLYRLSQDTLKRVIFPLASYTKKEVVSLAKEIKLPIEYRESQDVCFLKDKDYKTFLLERYKGGINEGDILDKEGKVLGRHKGLAFYTIGQRKGLGIALGYPLYVVGKDIEKNTITVGKAEDCFVDFVKAKDCSFISFPKSQLKARVRYKAEDTDAELQRMDDGSVVVRFKKRVFAPSPGQSIVFYEEDALIGGGIIE